MNFHETIITGMDIASPIITKLVPIKPKKTKIKKSIKSNT